MSSERLFVLDTNIIISAFLVKEGKARKALDKAQANGLVLMSVSVLAELEEVLTRPKFDKYVTVTERKLLLAGFVKTVKFVEIEETIRVCRDPKDDKYLELQPFPLWSGTVTAMSEPTLQILGRDLGER